MRRLAALLACLALLAAARGLIRHNTWYLASDQFAFLTFADDLTHGRIFHDPSTVELLAGPSLPKDAAVDAYYQTYIFQDDRLFSRYPPGYPLLLAAVKLAGGATAEHWLNPVLYLVLMGFLGLLAARLAPTAPSWVAAATAMWALLVIPVEVHYWGITVARDLPAHLLALGALLAAVAGAPTWSGLLLGLGATVRPDVVLWGPPVALALPDRCRRVGLAARAGLAFLVGVLPLFAYNTVTQGHPLAFTQGSEFRGLLESGLFTPAPLLAGVSFVSGGAFRLVHFANTFPVHVIYLVRSFGVFLLVALGFLVVAIRQERLARALGAYAVVGLLFYSCWSHGDPRYLVGVSLSLIVLTSAALARLAGALSAGPASVRIRLVAVATVGALLTLGAWLPRDDARGLTWLEWSSAGALALAWAASLVAAARPFAVLLPGLAFALFGMARVVGSSATGDGFGAADVDRARAAIEADVPAGALVLTSTSLGRPAENWTYYTHADAQYVSELPRLLSDANYVCYRCTLIERPFFLLLGAGEPSPFTVPADRLTMHEVARREGQALRDWFVDPKRAPGGAVLYRARISLPGS